MLNERIWSIEECSGETKVILTMYSGRRFKFQSHGYYGKESSLDWEEIEPVEPKEGLDP